MIIEASLPRDQFVRITLLQHFQRLPFYLLALTSGALIAWAMMFGGPFILILVGLTPFGIYIMTGLISAFVGSRNKDAPYFKHTRYVFTDQGVRISSTVGESQLEWEHFAAWRVMVGCYVLFLSNGSMLAFPQNAVPPHQVERFEQLLREHIHR